MEFELKKAYTVGGVKVGETTSVQQVNITVGIVGAPDDVNYYLRERTVGYEFPNSLNILEAADGVQPFAVQWVSDNYPNI